MKRIVFAGTPEIARSVLKTLIHSEHEVIACLTKPDKPSGRGRKKLPNLVKMFALSNKIPVYEPITLHSDSFKLALKKMEPSILIVIAYGLILPKDILMIPRYGCINVHASLLPKWRGASPIQHSILAGDNRSGITIIQMDTGLDTGDILNQEPCVISPKATCRHLYERLSNLGSKVLLETLDKLTKGSIIPKPQDDKLASYATKIQKKDGYLNWHHSSIVLERQIRAFNPWPIAFTYLDTTTIRIFEAISLSNEFKKKPGTILSASKSGLLIATGNGNLNITKLQFPNKKPMLIHAILNSKKELFKTGIQLL